jgi:thymidylate synthase ThyX
MRYIRFEDIPYWLPHSIQDEHGDSQEIRKQKAATRAIFERAFQDAQSRYAELTAIWKGELAPDSKFSKKKEITSMMRRIIPIGVATGGIWTMNLRALRHVCTMRADEAAEEEINALATRLLEHMMRTEIHFFGDFSKNAKGYYQPKHNKV